MANEAPITLEQIFRFYRGLPHQSASISMLEEDLRKNGYSAAMRRDRPWFITWSQAGRVPELKAAVDIIREFEGFSAKAYPDPLSGGMPYTLGYGTTVYPTGRPVKLGDTCTQEEAQRYLINECQDIAHHLASVIPGWREMNEDMQSALVSFAYNLGRFYGSIGFETITRTLREKRWKDVPNALMLYRNPGSNVEAGLKRRRQAEGTLWMKGLMAGNATNQPPAPDTQAATVQLNVPYEFQLDNVSGTGYRECFSSSCAMIARYYGKVANDDAYNKIRAKYGDSTDAQAQLAALKSLGLIPTYTQSGDAAMLERELRAGRPVAVGWLHHGSASAPSGGGHWTVVTGFTKDAFIHNDPNGTADMINGGYSSSKGGKGVAYSRKNWMPRWRVDGTGGWAITVLPS